MPREKTTHGIIQTFRKILGRRRLKEIEGESGEPGEPGGVRGKNYYINVIDFLRFRSLISTRL